MPEKTRLKYLAGALVILTLVAVVVLHNYKNPQKAPPSEPGYYSGPFRSKSDPNVYSTDDNKVVPAPPGAHIAVPGASDKPAGTSP